MIGVVLRKGNEVVGLGEGGQLQKGGLKAVALASVKSLVVRLDGAPAAVKGVVDDLADVFWSLRQNYHVFAKVLQQIGGGGDVHELPYGFIQCSIAHSHEWGLTHHARFR